jgi:WhiB family redox-sensing transcriptional regulator
MTLDRFPEPRPLPAQYRTVTPDHRQLSRDEWMAEALCAQIGTDDWFPEKGDNPKPAQRVCAACPVAAQCLRYALENRIRYGLWGGVPPKKRARMLNKRSAA